MAGATNSFEGGTSGVTMTTGNTGGASGDAFDFVTIGTSATGAFTTHSAHGSLGAVVATGTTSATSFFGWNTKVGTTTAHYGRAYINLQGTPASSDAFIEWQNSGTFIGAIQLTTGRQLLIQNAAFSTVHTMTTVLTVGTKYRVEWHLVNSATTGTLQVSLYVGDSVTATETYTSGSTNFAAQATQYQWGWNNGHANQPQVWIDDVAISTTGPLGPAVSIDSGAGALAASATLTAAGTRSVPALAALAAAPTLTAAGLHTAKAAAALSAPGTLSMPPAGPYVVASSPLASGASTYNVPVIHATNVGDGITVAIGPGGTAPPAVSSVTDSQGQKYRQLQQTSASPYIAVFECPGDIALATTDHLIVNFAANATGGLGVAAAATPGQRTVDVNTAPATGSTASPSVSGTPSAAGETALAALVWASAGGAGTISAPFTQLTQARQPGGAYTTLATASGFPSGSALTASASITSAAWRAVLLTFKTVKPWYLSLGQYIHEMYQIDPVNTAALFNTPTAFAISNNPASTGIQDGFACTPLLKYVSYAQLQADIAAGAINPAFRWVMYDNEYVDDGSGGNSWGTPMSEANDPWTAMANFVTAAHGAGLGVILAPARDLGNNASLVQPKNPGESLDAWFLRTNIAGAAAAAGTDVVHIQAQADQLTLSAYTSFWLSALAQVGQNSATAQASIGVSTTYGAATDMAAAAKAVIGSTWGYWVNLTDATASEAASFLALMNGSTAATQSGAAALSASATLGATGKHTAVALTSLAAPAHLTVAGTRGVRAQAALAAAPAITPAGRTTELASAHLAAAPVLSAPGVPGRAGHANLAASPVLTAAGKQTALAHAALSAPGQLGAGSVRTQLATAHLATAPALSATAHATVRAAAVFSAPGVVASAGVRKVLATTALSAPGTLHGAASSVTGVGGFLVAAATLSVAGSVQELAGGVLSAPGHLVAPAVRGVHAAAALSAGPVLGVTVTRSASGQAHLQATPALSASGVRTTRAGVSFGAAPVLAVNGSQTRAGVAHLAASASMMLTAARGPAGSAHLAAPGSVRAPATVTRYSPAHLTAVPVLGATVAPVAGSAVLQASPVIEATATSMVDPDQLWEIYSQAASAATAAEQNYWEALRAGGAGVYAGRISHDLYVAQGNAAAAYQAWQAAARSVSPGARG